MFSDLMQRYKRSFNTIMVAEISDDSMRDYGDTLVFAGTSLGNIDMDYLLSQIPESRGDFGLQAYILNICAVSLLNMRRMIKAWV